MTKRLAVLFTALLTLTACAASSASGPRRSGNVIGEEELQGMSVQNAYQAIERARPQWLNRRSSPSMANPDGTEPVVYVDGIRSGDLGELRGVRIEVVRRIEFMSPSDATNRYGTNHGGGAILVTTR